MIERQVSTVRIATLVIWLVILIRTPYTALSYLPEGYSQPLGLARRLLGDRITQFLFQYECLLALQVLGVLSCAALLLCPRGCRAAVFPALGSIAVLDCLTKSVSGFANHAQILAFLLLCICAVYWDLPYSRGLQGTVTRGDGGVTDHEWATVLWLCQLAAIVPYTLIALHRLRTGGVALFQGDTIVNYVMSNSQAQSSYGFTAFGVLAQSTWVKVALKTGFVVTTLCEGLSCCVLWWNSFRRLWLGVMIPFHVLTMLTMNIFFWENALLIAVLFGMRVPRRPAESNG